MSKKKQQPYFSPPHLPRTGVESHAHLNSRQFLPDFEAVLERAAAAGVDFALAAWGLIFGEPENIGAVTKLRRTEVLLSLVGE